MDTPASAAIDSKTIMDAFVHIRETAPSVTGDKEAHFVKMYPDIQSSFPYLFHKACTDTAMDLETLKYMLEMRDSLLSKKLDNEEASKQVGQTMFDTFVKPMLDNQK